MNIANERLSKERLAEIVEEYTHAIYPAEVGQMARELLSLRNGEGDEEVEKYYDMASQWIGKSISPLAPEEAEQCIWAGQALASLHREAIARGQQLRAAKRREQIMAHHCQKYVEMTWEQAEAAYDAAETVEISREEIDRIVDLVVNGSEEDREEKDLGQQLREAQSEVERLRIQLAGCLTAAEGHFPDPPILEGDYAWTPAYQKTLNLRRNWDSYTGTRAKPQHEDGDGGYSDLLPGGMDQ